MAPWFSTKYPRWSLKLLYSGWLDPEHLPTFVCPRNCLAYSFLVIIFLFFGSFTLCMHGLVVKNDSKGALHRFFGTLLHTSLLFGPLLCNLQLLQLPWTLVCVNDETTKLCFGPPSLHSQSGNFLQEEIWANDQTHLICFCFLTNLIQCCLLSDI